MLATIKMIRYKSVSDEEEKRIKIARSRLTGCFPHDARLLSEKMGDSGKIGYRPATMAMFCQDPKTADLLSTGRTRTIRPGDTNLPYHVCTGACSIDATRKRRAKTEIFSRGS
jgi:hypothetical protein